MRRLRPTDGTPQHKRCARYHSGTLAANGGALHLTLRGEMLPLLAALTAAERAVEDAEDALVDAQAAEDYSEINIENLIRDIDADLGKLDRQDASLNARATVFPDGYGAEIDPESEAQLKRLTPLRARLAKFDNIPVIHDFLVQFDAATTAFTNAIKATDNADTLVNTLFVVEVDVRRAIREQLESAYGRLRAFYKSAPARAEAFFLREGSRRPRTPEAPVTPPTPPTTP